MGLADEFSYRCLDPVVPSLAPAAAIMVKEQWEKDKCKMNAVRCEGLSLTQKHSKANLKTSKMYKGRDRQTDIKDLNDELRGRSLAMSSTSCHA